MYRCNGRQLEFDREDVVATDYQRIKLQEVDGRDDRFADMEGSSFPPAPSETGEPSVGTSMVGPSRVPRTFEVELRGDHLVDRCISGDLVVCVGEIKMMQVPIL